MRRPGLLATAAALASTPACTLMTSLEGLADGVPPPAADAGGPATLDAGGDTGASPDADTGASSAYPASCSDGVKDGAETDVDCGGAFCAQCDRGARCLSFLDCSSYLCKNTTCR